MTKKTKQNKEAESAPGNSKRGFTLLLSVLISSLMLALATSIFTMLSQQLTISGISKESQFAFYAADTGVECALYWDLQEDAFATSSPYGSIDCNGESRSINSTTAGTKEIRTFYLDFQPEPYCAKVKITKEGSPVRTTIKAKGYNKGYNRSTGKCDKSYPRKLQRAIRIRY